MQIMEGAATDWSTAHPDVDYRAEHLWHPRTNITVGTWYLARAVRHWEQQDCRDPLPFALAEYNAGRGNVNAWVEQSDIVAAEFVEQIPFPGTRQYIEDILARYRGDEAIDGQ